MRSDRYKAVAQVSHLDDRAKKHHTTHVLSARDVFVVLSVLPLRSPIPCTRVLKFEIVRWFHHYIHTLDRYFIFHFLGERNCGTYGGEV